MHSPPATKEWSNSIYSYDKNSLFKLLPLQDKNTYKVLRGYFNFNAGKLKNFKRLAKAKIFISKPEIKHSINKVVITIYTYNREKFYFIYKLKKLSKLFINNFKYNKAKLLLKRTKFIYKYIRNEYISRLSTLLKNTFNKKNLDKYYLNFLDIIIIKLLDYNNFLKKKKNREFVSYLKNNKEKFILNLMKKFLKIEYKNILLYKYYYAMLYFNSYKFNINNLLGLKEILSKIYNKKIELNIINLKYLYLDNNIFTEAIVRKLKDRKKRIQKVLKMSLRLVRKPSLNIYLYNKPYLIYLENILHTKNLKKEMTYTKNIIFKPFAYKTRLLLFFLKHKVVSGIRIQGTGRLTQRLTASRSMSKEKYKGSLKNLNSSYANLPTIMLRGFVKSNLQYVNLNSKTRNGAFGVKSWLSCY